MKYHIGDTIYFAHKKEPRYDCQCVIDKIYDDRAEISWRRGGQIFSYEIVCLSGFDNFDDKEFIMTCVKKQNHREPDHLPEELFKL